MPLAFAFMISPVMNNRVTFSAPPVLAAPINTVPPVVIGSGTVGDVLACSTGGWTGSPSPNFTYQWTQTNVDIVGQTDRLFTPQPSSIGAQIRCVVRGTNASGTATATSNATLITP